MCRNRSPSRPWFEVVENLKGVKLRSMSRRKACGLGFALAACLVPAAARAHPHVWIEARATIAYAAGKPVSVRHSWTFDPAYSAFLTLGAGRGADGAVPDGSLDAQAAQAVASTADSDYFTEARIPEGKMGLGTPSGAAMAMWGDRATLSFELPLARRDAPSGEPPPGQARLEVMDPSYFVSFAFAEGEPVTLEGAPEGCAVEVRRPKGFSGDDAKTLAAGILTALSGADAFDRIGNVAIVRCPVP